MSELIQCFSFFCFISQIMTTLILNSISSNHSCSKSHVFILSNRWLVYYIQIMSSLSMLCFILLFRILGGSHQNSESTKRGGGGSWKLSLFGIWYIYIFSASYYTPETQNSSIFASLSINWKSLSNLLYLALSIQSAFCLLLHDFSSLTWNRDPSSFWVLKDQNFRHTLSFSTSRTGALSIFSPRNTFFLWIPTS